MPSTRIETRTGWVGNRRQELIEAVQAALLEGLLIPREDRCVRLTEYDHDAFIIPTGKGATYTFVEVTLFLGRSLDAKRRLYRAMVEQLGHFGVPDSDIKVALIEMPCSATIKVRTPVNQDEKTFCRLRRREGEARPKAQATENLA